MRVTRAAAPASPAQSCAIRASTHTQLAGTHTAAGTARVHALIAASAWTALRSTEPGPQWCCPHACALPRALTAPRTVSKPYQKKIIRFAIFSGP